MTRDPSDRTEPDPQVVVGAGGSDGRSPTSKGLGNLLSRGFRLVPRAGPGIGRARTCPAMAVRPM